MFHQLMRIWNKTVLIHHFGTNLTVDREVNLEQTVPSLLIRGKKCFQLTGRNSEQKNPK